jgi:hypothetical protein
VVAGVLLGLECSTTNRQTTTTGTTWANRTRKAQIAELNRRFTVRGLEKWQERFDSSVIAIENVRLFNDGVQLLHRSWRQIKGIAKQVR